ncbi:hypothetical protein G6N76_09515 [Rhizobium daejeonense]|uniref:Uncharacterized protein n=1 Tax=Rhizobium daejeonense TaxID=240521 RepID=A0A6M1RYV2_9HYPH|nr:hypothetical protein [Rhizobium daejeonense]NGO63913.1 hypothetical protein [Rhizobium daejeonense]
MIPKEAIEAAAKAACKDNINRIHLAANERGGSNSMSGSEYFAYPPSGWPDFLASMEAALTAAFAAMSDPVGYVHADFEKELSCYDVASMVPNNRSCGSFKFIPLYAAPQPAAVKVKPLKWDKNSYGGSEAMSAVGVFRIVDAWSGGWSVSRNNGMPLQTTDGRKNFATIEAAKSAAQSDYETRILSALEGGGEERGRIEERERWLPDVEFLLDRLYDINLDDDTDDLIRDWNGHVEPAIARLRAITKEPTP